MPLDPTKINKTHLYTTHEVAEILSVSDETVRSWIRQGKLQASRVGKRYLIKGEALLRVLREQ